MKLALRNWLAERCLAALEAPDDDSAATLGALANGLDDAGKLARLAQAERAALLAPGSPFEPDGAGLRLREEHVADVPRVRERVARIVRAARTYRARGGTGAADDAEAAVALRKAAALFDAGLFFETHEILEPAWKSADEPLRTFLQGLIQIAAGYHHRSQRNLRGAESLLREGVARLHPFGPAAYAVDVRALLAAVETTLGALDEEPSEPPRLIVG